MTEADMRLPSGIIDIHNHLSAKDQDAKQILGLMDKMDIEKTLVMGTSKGGNEKMLAAVELHPDRLVGGAYVDPREGAAAIDRVAQYYEQGIRLIKLFPNLGYFPDDGQFIPFFGKIAELGMGVLSHCGWLTPSMNVTAAYYSHPGRFEKVARQYPEMPMIMAHMGGIAGFLETVMLTTRTPNVYTDCSPGQGVWVLECAPEIAGSIPVDRIMWGADCYYDQVWFDRQKDALARCGFADNFQKVYRDNALGILKQIGAVK